MKKRLAASIILGVVLIGASAAGGQDAGNAGLAKHVLELAGISRGLCSVLGVGAPSLPVDLVQSSTFLVHVLEPQQNAVAALRKAAGEHDIPLQRLVVERLAWDRLPYADNMIDVVVAADVSKESLDKVSLPEVMRALRPLGKVVAGVSATKGAALTRPQLEQWARSAGGPAATIHQDADGLWAIIRKPAPSGTDVWSHWEHGPDNNPVSTDAVIKAPYRTQWLGLPYYIAMPAITTAAGGRTFLAMGHIAHHEREEPWLNTLLARDAYNGSELWRLRLPDGYLAHRSAFVATDDVFYMIDTDGRGCTMLDPETGEHRGEVRVPEAPGDWKWIALQGRVLYALAGQESDPPETTVVRSGYPAWSWGELSKGYYEQPKVPWGFGETLLAYDLDKRKVLWTHRETAPVDSRAIALGEGKLFFYAPDARAGCLDAATGAVVWTNDNEEVRRLINELGQNLTSTPGFRTTCYCVYTPKGLYFEAQTQMNLVAVSKDDGRLLWHRKKTTSNPNVIYADGTVYAGIGEEGRTLALNPASGDIIEDLGFMKRSCARLTATPDSFFCRGYPEGITRYDRATKNIFFDGSMRPACNDGVIASNGLLYIGPWLCDCNLSLMGTAALCSAGEPVKPQPADARLEKAVSTSSEVAAFQCSADDWPAYRGNNHHTGGSPASVSSPLQPLWTWKPARPYAPSAPTAAGGLVFLAGDDGVVRAIDARLGTPAWSFQTAGPILQPPSIWEGRAYAGSGDGCVYALEAATGRLLWRFQAAPVARRIMVYGSLCSTWPVNTGVLVQDGVAYVAAGIIDYDGTYLSAIDAKTGSLLWENDSTGFLNAPIRKGVSAQGGMTVMTGSLWMAGGNVVSPAKYKLETGEYKGETPGQGFPQSNRGEEIGVFRDDFLIFGGRLQYSARENVVNPGVFTIARYPERELNLAEGQTAPAWDAGLIAVVPRREAPPQAYAASEVVERLKSKKEKVSLPSPVWQADALSAGQTLALALTKDSLVAACRVPRQRDLRPNWRLCLLDRGDGALLCNCDLPSAVRQNGIAIDKDGRILVAMADGSLCCYGGGTAFRSYLASLAGAAKNDAARQPAIERIMDTLDSVHDTEGRDFLVASLQELGVDVFGPIRKSGGVAVWRILGPVPCDRDDNPMDKAIIKEPRVKVDKPIKLGDKPLRWERYTTIEPNGFANLAGLYGDLAGAAAYAYAEVKFERAQEVLLKLGSNDGFKCWFNDKEVGRFDGGRRYQPDQDAIPAHAKSGVNRILLKIAQEGGDWGYGVRITDPSGDACEAEWVTP